MKWKFMINDLGYAMRGVQQDQLYLKSIGGEGFNVRSSVRALALNRSIRAAFWFRLASRGGVLGRIARGNLLSNYACDVTPGSKIQGALYLPHPIGIVIGSGSLLLGSISIYQGVTIGANRRGQYPTIENGVRIFANAVVVGNITLSSQCVIGAGVFVSSDVGVSEVIRGGNSMQ